MTTNNLSTTSLPLPVLGETLITSVEPDWQYNARLDVPADDEWVFHADGFKIAAELLRDHLLVNTTDLDFVVYPMAFCYRHYFELKLKHLIIDGQKAGVTGIQLTLDHNLATLWANARKVIVDTWTACEPDVLLAADAQIAELVRIDPGSYDLRYPVDKQLQPSRTRGLGMMNVRQFTEVMGKLINLLECASAGMAADRDLDGEMA